MRSASASDSRACLVRRPDALDQVQQVLPFLADEGVAEERPDAAHVGAQIGQRVVRPTDRVLARPVSGARRRGFREHRGVPGRVVAVAPVREIGHGLIVDHPDDGLVTPPPRPSAARFAHQEARACVRFL